MPISQHNDPNTPARDPLSRRTAFAAEVLGRAGIDEALIHEAVLKSYNLRGQQKGAGVEHDRTRANEQHWPEMIVAATVLGLVLTGAILAMIAV